MTPKKGPPRHLGTTLILVIFTFFGVVQSGTRQIDLASVKGGLHPFYRFKYEIEVTPGAKTGIMGNSFNGIMIECRILEFENHLLYPVVIEQRFEIRVVQFLESSLQCIVRQLQCIHEISVRGSGVPFGY